MRRHRFKVRDARSDSRFNGRNEILGKMRGRQKLTEIRRGNWCPEKYFLVMKVLVGEKTDLNHTTPMPGLSII